MKGSYYNKGANQTTTSNDTKGELWRHMGTAQYRDSRCYDIILFII
jgi:hypothetical protein